MKKVLFLFLSGLMLLSMVGTAAATICVGDLCEGPSEFYIAYDLDWYCFNNTNTTHTWTFDLLADTDVQAGDTIDSATLKMTFLDLDSDEAVYFFGFKLSDGELEFADLLANGIPLWDDREIDSGIFSFDVLGVLNSDYTLDVTINRLCGDFQAGLASLSGCYTPVPEPGTLILLGAGLAGLAIYRKKRNC